jgi:hypothetical protein
MHATPAWVGVGQVALNASQGHPVPPPRQAKQAHMFAQAERWTPTASCTPGAVANVPLAPFAFGQGHPARTHPAA